MQGSLTSRKAGPQDVPALAAISKECFRERIQWQSRTLSFRYWEGIMRSDACEIWLWEVDGKPAAFALFVLDLSAWAELKGRFDRYGLSDKLSTLARHPAILFHKVMVRRTREEDVYVPPPRPEERRKLAEWLAEGESPGAGEEWIPYGGVRVPPTRLFWFERAGILPRFRQFGIALHLLQLAERRARETGRQAIGGAIEEHRKSWCWLHERAGYVDVKKVRNRFTFIKLLGPDRRAVPRVKG